MDCQKRNLIINYLPADLTESELAELFSACGEIKKTKIIRDGRTGNSLGYGFVVFAKTCSAVAAQILVNGHKIRGKTLKVAFARPRGENIMNANLYVSFLPLNVNEEQLETLFGECGKIIETKILRDKETGLSRGIGFIRFDLHSSAKKAKNTLNFYCFAGTTNPISVKFRHAIKMEPVEATDNPKDANPGVSEHPTTW